MSKSENRHHHQRMVERAKRMISLRWMRYWDKDKYDEQVRQHAETRKACSCTMCGNPRRTLKEKTIQERRFCSSMV